MALSVVDLFKIGIGPSSSHTVGPMWATHYFLLDLQSRNYLKNTARIEVDLYGSLALTGHGHATDTAILMGLLGEVPDKINPDTIQRKLDTIRDTHHVKLLGIQDVQFKEARDLRFNFGEFLDHHSNGMKFQAKDGDDNILLQDIYYSVGGGFVMSEDEMCANSSSGETVISPSDNIMLPYPFDSAEELLAMGREKNMSIVDMMWENEGAFRTREETAEKLRDIWLVMDGCIERGCHEQGVLPGGLNVKRRAHDIHKTLKENSKNHLRLPLQTMDWVNLFALAVNEENAAGGKVVTAPTNGAAGVIPAVIAYYDRFVPDATEEGISTILLVASAIGMLYKKNASISAAEVGCQGEVGVACSMAAGGLTAALGGSNEQIENAAEIGMEHNLGLTCDPIGGLVQIPCIERNTMGAVKAINAARLSLHGDGTHFVPLDKVIQTMFETGRDMQNKYKETSTGGLAVNVVEC